MKPEIGAPHELDSETRIVAVDDRGERMYVVQVKFGPTGWQDHGGPHDDFSDALTQAHRVMRRERQERVDLASGGFVQDWPGGQPWSQGFPEVARYDGRLDMAGLSARIHAARRKIGWDRE